MAFQGVILCRVQSFLSPRMDLNFRHLSSCDTIVYISCKYVKFEKIFHFLSLPGVMFLRVLTDKLGGLSNLHTSP